MIHVATEQFIQWMEESIQNLPLNHRDAIKNVGFFVMDRPTDEQAERVGLQPGYILLGLYDGVPLPQRNGAETLYPDRITLFQEPIEMMCDTVEELKEQIRHTVWHEVAHYFGLNHDDIHKLE